MSDIWNHKFSGISGAVLSGIHIICRKIADKCSTIIVTHNLNGCGRGVVIMHGLLYRYPQRITLGNSVVIGRYGSMSTERCDGYLEVHDNVTIGNKCCIDFTGGIIIKDNTHIAHNVNIITHDHGYDYRAKPIGKSLRIGENVFIGSHCNILPSCNIIGDNVVIGLGSIVTKDIPDNAIVAGNPARIINYRTSSGI